MSTEYERLRFRINLNFLDQLRRSESTILLSSNISERERERESWFLFPMVVTFGDRGRKDHYSVVTLFLFWHWIIIPVILFCFVRTCTRVYTPACLCVCMLRPSVFLSRTSPCHIEDWDLREGRGPWNDHLMTWEFWSDIRSLDLSLIDLLIGIKRVKTDFPSPNR